MYAIILAAGAGNRLAEFNADQRPKCLLQFGGLSLLARQLACLNDVGVRHAEVVVGYEANRIVEHVGTLERRPEVVFSYNPRFSDGSVVSLLTARDSLNAGRDVLVMDADVLFHPEILGRLVRSRHANCFLLDREFEAGDEPVKIALRNGAMVDFRKSLAGDLEFDALGESVGFIRLAADSARDVAGICAAYENEGLADAPHEEALRDLLLRAPERFGFEDISGLPWIEIDFPEDVERAVKSVLPDIRGNDGER